MRYQNCFLHNSQKLYLGAVVILRTALEYLKTWISLIQQNIQNYIINKALVVMFRPRNNQRSTCDRHHFSLKPRNEYVLYPQHLTLSFCKEESGEFRKSKHVKRANSCINCPTFNKDSNYASPAFILKSERKYYQQSKKQIQTQHEEKYLQYTDQKSQLKIPKPKSRNNYCSVCHVNYQDYLQHTQNPFHLGKVKKSAFNRHIHDLADTFRQKINKQIAVNSQEKQIVMEINDSEDYVEIIQNPQKKTKEDCNNTPYTTQGIQTPNAFSFYTQSSLDYVRQLAQFYQSQLAVNNFWNYFNTTFQMIPQNNPHFNNFMTMQPVSYPFMNLNQENRGKEVASTQNSIPCIIIDD